jgi:hypothetical protein
MDRKVPRNMQTFKKQTFPAFKFIERKHLMARDRFSRKNPPGK